MAMTSLGSRLEKKDIQLNNSLNHCSKLETSDRVQHFQLNEHIKDLKSQLNECKKSNSMLQTEKLHLQEAIHRLESEMASRCDVLQKLNLEFVHQENEHKAEVKKVESELCISLKQLEAKWIDSNKQLEQCKKESKAKTEIIQQSTDEIRSLRHEITNIESRNRILSNELEAATLYSERLNNEVEHLKIKLSDKNKNLVPTRDERNLIGENGHKCYNDLRSLHPSRQDGQSILNFPIGSIAKCVNRTPMNSLAFTETTFDDIQSRVEALKSANQALRDEVDQAYQLMENNSNNKQPNKIIQPNQEFVDLLNSKIEILDLKKQPNQRSIPQVVAGDKFNKFGFKCGSARSYIPMDKPHATTSHPCRSSSSDRCRTIRSVRIGATANSRSKSLFTNNKASLLNNAKYCQISKYRAH